ncbi:MAG TPA: alpha/beta fold hydrolase, partial [Burkholderiaceae bacterium]|nr:alpha/beta fold hydrolase [Burkholderiaceae bacterium]
MLRVPARWIALAAIAAAAASGCATLDTWQRQAIFQAEAAKRFGADDPPPGVEAFDLTLENGETVHAWYWPAPRRDAPTVLFLHGARRNLSGSLSRIERWHALGFHVLAIDYRGFGRSSPRLPSEDSALQDARAAFAELLRREPDASKRFLYGYSLGGALAIALAAERDGIAGVIVESSFTSIADVVRHSKWGWIPGITWLVTQDFDSAARIRAVTEPLLFIHGTEDRVVPHTMSDRLYREARAVPAELKRVVKIEGARHYGLLWTGGEVYGRA